MPDRESNEEIPSQITDAIDNWVGPCDIEDAKERLEVLCAEVQARLDGVKDDIERGL